MLISNINFFSVINPDNVVVVGIPQPRYVFDNEGHVTSDIQGYLYPISDGINLQTVYVEGKIRKFGTYEAVRLVNPRFTYLSKNRELMASADDIQSRGNGNEK